MNQKNNSYYLGGNILSSYLDNSATTPVCNEAKEKMIFAITECWGNPSSTHKMGIKASEALDSARETVAGKLGCEKNEIYFTSGGTQSNNIAILGAAEKNAKRGNRIITTEIEHPSVAKTMDALKQKGFEIIRLPVEKNGVISIQKLIDSINEKTILISIMAVNNEVGSIQPIEKIKLALKRKNSTALIHCDAVQAFGKIPIRVKKLGVDLMSISSHKIHGPKGAGALYINNAIKINSPVHGGGQENGICSGTQSMPAICGFEGACKALPENLNLQLEKTKILRDYFVEEFIKIPGAAVNSPDDALPYIINISLLKKRSEPIINFLSEKGIYVSAGSACSKGHRSDVLLKMGYDAERIDGALRISLSRFTEKEDMDYLLSALNEANLKLRGS